MDVTGQTTASFFKQRQQKTYKDYSMVPTRSQTGHGQCLIITSTPPLIHDQFSSATAHDSEMFTQPKTLFEKDRLTTPGTREHVARGERDGHAAINTADDGWSQGTADDPGMTQDDAQGIRQSGHGAATRATTRSRYVEQSRRLHRIHIQKVRKHSERVETRTDTSYTTWEAMATTSNHQEAST